MTGLIRGLGRALGLAAALLILATAPAVAQCPPGHYEAGQWCIPNGHTHCGGGRTCPPNMRCAEGGTCLPAGAVSCDGGKFCPAGTKCGSGGACLRPTDTDCGNGKFCPDNQRCGPNNSCLAANDPPPDGTCQVGIGPPTPTQCSNESSGQNCRCLNLTNNCSFGVMVTYTVTGSTYGRRELRLGPGERSGLRACTSQSGQTIAYGSARREN
jgi:hypothetical protein